jgi:hypothetical protein
MSDAPRAVVLQARPPVAHAARGEVWAAVGTASRGPALTLLTRR